MRYKIITPTSHSSRDLEISSSSPSVELDLQISVMKCYEVMALTSHLGFCDLVTLKLGQGHSMSNLTFRLGLPI